MRMSKKGFTLVEIMIVLGILALLSAAIAFPAVKKNMDNARKTICVEDRRVVEHGEQRFFLDNQRHSADLEELVVEGYVKKIPKCPSNGVYAWTYIDISDPAAQSALGCSVHFVEAGDGGTVPPVVTEPPVVPPGSGGAGGGQGSGKDKNKDKGGSKK
jgi:prepilin-type N-terminal cleavage/methylation domain-containing protein